MITIKAKLAPTWFALPGEPPAEFLLKPLSSPEWQDVRNELTENGKGEISITGEGLKISAQYAVLDWRNVFSESGEQLKFDRHMLEELPRESLVAIAGEVFARAQLSEMERKN